MSASASASSAALPEAIDYLGRDFIDDPHPVFARLRERAPVCEVGSTGVFWVTRWSLVEEALGREADFSAHLTGVLLRGEDGEPVDFALPVEGPNQVIATADEPEHAVHRRLSQPRLAAPRVGELEVALRGWVDEALAPWLAAGGGDFVPLAETVPARAVALVLGLPEGDVAHFRRWAMMGGSMLAGDVGHAEMFELATETRRMIEYLREHLEPALAAPRDGAGAPLLHALARGVNAGEISADVAVGIATVMFGAGGESTAALLASAAWRLALDPALADRLRAEPALIARYVEEVARLESPFKFHYRVVRRPCTLGGIDLVAGNRLMLCWAAANRDPARFEDPDALRLDRRHPKDHLGFGRGAHFCIGAPLARLEARAMLEALLARTSRIALDPGAPPVWAHSIFVRRLERLALTAATR